jgi:hypothetical protein
MADRIVAGNATRKLPQKRGSKEYLGTSETDCHIILKTFFSSQSSYCHFPIKSRNEPVLKNRTASLKRKMKMRAIIRTDETPANKRNFSVTHSVRRRCFFVKISFVINADPLGEFLSPQEDSLPLDE